MSGVEGVLERASGPTKATRKARDLDRSPLERQTYLSPTDLREYLRKPTVKAVYRWLEARPGLPRLRDGRSILLRRRDVDDWLKGEGRERVPVAEEHREGA